jgi:hypothetical protein
LQLAIIEPFVAKVAIMPGSSPCIATTPLFPRLNFNYFLEIHIEFFSLIVYVSKILNLGNLFFSVLSGTSAISRKGAK